MATNYKDIPTKDWGMSLTADGEVLTDIDDISQCIQIILNTRRGSSPIRPEFGTEIWKWIDKPTNVAIPNIKREILENVALWEPRATITSITHQLTDIQHITFTINFVFASTGQTKTTTFDLSLQR
jgi:phage baseplate assembly protein W